LPYRLQTSGVGWLVAAVVLVGLELAVFGRGLRGAAVAVTVADDAVVRWLGGLHAPGLQALWQGLAHIGSWWTVMVLWIGLLLALVVLRRWRHLIVWLVAWQLGGLVSDVVVARTAQRARPFGVDLRTSWGGWAMPSLQVTFMTAVLMAVLYTLVPEGRWRNTGKWVAAGLVALVCVARVALGTDAPTDVLVAVGIGVAIPLLLFRRFTPSEVFPVTYRRGRSAHLDVGGTRGEAIRRAIEEQLGLVVLGVTPFGQQWSASSTPLRITIEGDPPRVLFGKLYAQSHLRADRWYKLGRELRYGRLEDEKSFNTVRRLVEHEDYALRRLRDAGLPVPGPLGSVELTPEREYLLVTEFLEGAREISDAEVDDTIIDEGLAIIRGLWNARLAHRDIKPANMLVQDGHLRLIDANLTQVHPSPWRQAVDLANMLLVLGLRTDAARVYRQARRMFTDEEIGEALAAKQGQAMPSQLRRLVAARQPDLREEFLRLLPWRPRPIAIQRWSLRRVGLWASLVVLLFLALLNPTIIFDNATAVRTPLNTGNLSCAHLEPLWLEAQSVPSASLVPCVRSPLAGWIVTDVAVNNGRSVITLDHDRAGGSAVVVRLAAVCDTTGTVGVPSPAPGVLRYERVDQSTSVFGATWYDRFPGGCVTYRLHSASDVEGSFAVELPALLGFVNRDTLRAALSQRSGGRLQLDAGAAR
jgi:membrane-associated phospholipid phosphatase/tRNA A-37 threonylcarbamoyl transferase component Bud32